MRRAKKTPACCFSISPQVPVISPHLCLLSYKHRRPDDAGKAKAAGSLIVLRVVLRRLYSHFLKRFFDVLRVIFFFLKINLCEQLDFT